MADLFELVYNPPEAIHATLGTTPIKWYSRIFAFICPLRLLQSSVNEVWWKVEDVIRAKRIKVLGDKGE